MLDAPCSGLGVISRDPSVKVQRTIADVQKCAQLQKEMIIQAIDCLKYKNTSGGVLVYSTCSVSIYENEEVVQYALQKRDIQIVDSGLDFGTNGYTRYQNKRFHPSMALCKRFYPHTVNMDGFFVCKIKKLSDKMYSTTNNKDDNIDNEDTTTIATTGRNTDAVGSEQNRKGLVAPTGASNQKKKEIGSKKESQQKRKKEDDINSKQLKQKKKESNISKPPSSMNQQQQTTKPAIQLHKNSMNKKASRNAKVTKPRRTKKETTATDAVDG